MEEGTGGVQGCIDEFRKVNDDAVSKLLKDVLRQIMRYQYGGNPADDRELPYPPPDKISADDVKKIGQFVKAINNGDSHNYDLLYGRTKEGSLLSLLFGDRKVLAAVNKQSKEKAKNAAKVPKVEEPSVADGPDDDAGLVPMPLVGGKMSEKEAEIARKLEFSLCVAEFEKIENESVKQVFKYEIFELIRQRDDDKSENATARLNNLKQADVENFVKEVNKAIGADKEVTPKAFQKLMAGKNTPSSINHVFAGIKADVFAAEKKESLFSKLRSKKASAAEQDAGPKKGLKDLLPKKKEQWRSIDDLDALPKPTKGRFGGRG